MCTGIVDSHTHKGVDKWWGFDILLEKNKIGKIKEETIIIERTMNKDNK